MSSDKEHLFYKKIHTLKQNYLEEINKEKQQKLAEEQKLIAIENEYKQRAYSFFIKIMMHKNNK